MRNTELDTWQPEIQCRLHVENVTHDQLHLLRRSLGTPLRHGIRAIISTQSQTSQELIRVTGLNRLNLELDKPNQIEPNPRVGGEGRIKSGANSGVKI